MSLKLVFKVGCGGLSRFWNDVWHGSNFTDASFLALVALTMIIQISFDSQKLFLVTM